MPAVRLRGIVSVLVVAPLLVACGGDGEPEDAPSTSISADAEGTGVPSGDAADAADACSLLTPEEVSQAVGTEVGEGVPAGGEVITGGSQTTCTWTGVENAASVATVTVYTDASAADSVRTDDSAPLPEVGDDAFAGSFASVWGYAGGGSFMAQWYELGGTDEDNLPKSTALALLVRDAL
jgi:hypothetical protein